MIRQQYSCDECGRKFAEAVWHCLACGRHNSVKFDTCQACWKACQFPLEWLHQAANIPFDPTQAPKPEKAARQIVDGAGAIVPKLLEPVFGDILPQLRSVSQYLGRAKSLMVKLAKSRKPGTKPLANKKVSLVALINRLKAELWECYPAEICSSCEGRGGHCPGCKKFGGEGWVGAPPSAKTKSS